MTLLRSVLFGVFFYGGVIVAGIVFLPLLILPSAVARPVLFAWLRYASFCTRTIAGIKHQLIVQEGAELPDGPALFAAKHQSAWETLAFNLILPDPVFVLKKELKKVPFFGWYLVKMRQIAVDRSAGASAMRGMVHQAKEVFADGFSVVIYPQGTRVGIGDPAPYHPGIFALYRALEQPVIPIALNSGRLWSRNGLIKRAGMVTVSVLPAIPPGLDRKTFMSQLETTIETETARLERL